ncbi:MAG: peptidoglycan-associated lipoprotein Pal [Burkholderiaceae bacterium]|nr:peptidoglycan-associated lipoprotein Pal [Burkholderiaceae bacterium]
MMKRISFALAAAALVAGCSSGVDLDKAPVEDKSGTPLSTLGVNGGMGMNGANGVGGANGGLNGANGGVTGVDLARSGRDGAGPTGMSRIVYFDYDSYVLKPDFQSLVESHAQFIKAGPTRTVVIEGHTDDRGGREYNLALGQKRAEAVRRSLGLLGVPDKQIEAVSFGKEKPAAQGNNEDAYAQNRRAELSYR